MYKPFDDPEIRKHFLEGGFGLEKEGLRVDQQGFLAHTPHPFGDDPHYDRDFCENQLELVTDVYGSTEEVWEALADMQKIVARTLAGYGSGELIWPFSNPPYVKGEEDIPIARFEGDKRDKTVYREYLAGKYGRRKMLYSGIHFNYSLPDSLLRTVHQKYSCHEAYRTFKDRLYLRLARKVVEYDWLIVYLTAASPVLDGSFYSPDRMGEVSEIVYASPRCSVIGYWNSFIPILCYDDLDCYVKSIKEYVKRGDLRQEAELYYPVRLKPKGINSLDKLAEKGVDHIELRMLDLNPLTPVGVMKEDLFFLQLMLLYMATLKEDNFDYYEQVMSIKNAKTAALFDEDRIWIETRWRQAIPIREAALGFLEQMERFYREAGLAREEEVMACLQGQKTRVLFPDTRYAVRIRNQFKKDYVERGLALAREYSDLLRKNMV